MDSEFIRISQKSRKRKVAETNQIISEQTLQMALEKYRHNRVERLDLEKRKEEEEKEKKIMLSIYS